MIRLSLRVRREDAEVVLAELLELVPAGFEEVDAGAHVEYALYGAPGELPALPELRAVIGGALVDVRSEEVAEDWAERWRAFHRPLVLGDALAVRPPWEAPAGAALDVVIDPGQAFGTGGHATTRLCLELLLELPPGGALLDLGCGSGVLAIAAAKRGWGPVRAVDFDPLAVAAARANAAVNGVEVVVAREDLRDGPPAPSPMVLANLLRPLLLLYASQLAAAPRAAPEVLVASGLLRGEADEVAAAFARAGFAERERRAHGEWAGLVLSALRDGSRAVPTSSWNPSAGDVAPPPGTARGSVRTWEEDARHERTSGQPPSDRTRSTRG